MKTHRSFLTAKAPSRQEAQITKAPAQPWRLGVLAVILCALTGCGYKPAAKVCYVRNGNTVCVSADADTVKLHGEHADGKQVISGDLSLPLPTHGFSK